MSTTIYKISIFMYNCYNREVIGVINVELYVRLDEILDERGITRKKLAEMTGLRPNTISELCNNQRTTVNRLHIGKIAEVLEIENVSELLAIRK